jgi:hypothetical protein
VNIQGIHTPVLFVSGEPPPAPGYSPSLDFSDDRNSGYIALIPL